MLRRVAAESKFGIVAVAVVAVMASCAGAPAKKTKKKAKVTKVERAKKALRVAIKAEEAGNTERADENYRKAIKLRPTHAKTNRRFIRFLIGQGQSATAVERGQAYVKKNPGNPDAYHLLADAQMSASDYAAAIATLTELLGIDDEDAVAYDKRGRARLKNKLTKEALADFRKATALKPSSADFQISLADGLAQDGEQDKAADILDQLLKLDEENGRAYLVLGVIQRARGDTQAALSSHLKATQYLPEEPAAFFELGLTYNVRGDNLGAREALERAAELAPGDANNWYALGEIQRILESTDDASVSYRKAIEVDPEHPKAPSKLALLLIEKGDVGEAEKVLTEAVRRSPDAPAAYFTLGQVYEKQKKYVLAINAYKRFVDLDSESRNASTAKKRIRSLTRKVRRR